MTIKKMKEGNDFILNLEGAIKTDTARELSEEISKCGDDFRDLILDCEKLTTISSAGLRVLLNTHQDLKDGQRLILRNVPELIMDIFEITGFTDFLNIE